MTRSAQEALTRAAALKSNMDFAATTRWRIRSILDGGPEAIRALLGDRMANLSREQPDLPWPNLIHSGITALAQKLGHLPEARITPTHSTDSELPRKRAEKRERIINAFDDYDRMELQLPQVGRWLPGYGFAVWTVTARTYEGFVYPCVQLRDPHDCVDEETEILTKRGWLRHDEFTEEDTVAGYDLDTGLARWTDVHAVYRYDETDIELVAVDQRDLSMRLTPNHRAIVQQRTSQTIGGKREFFRGPTHVVRADELKSTHFIPRSAEWVETGEKSIGVPLATLLGWIAAEGSYHKGLVYISQSQSANPQHVATIDQLLADMPPFTADTGNRVKIRKSLFETTRSVRDRDGHIEVSWGLTLGLSQEVMRLMPDKTLGMWVADLPEDERRALLHAFIDGDGTWRKRDAAQIYQKDRANLDVLQVLAVMDGWKTSLRPMDDKWTLHLTRGPSKSLRSRGKNNEPIRRERYKGVVWCPTTGTGTFFARRNGFVFVTGNCYPGEWGVDQQPQELAVYRRIPHAEAKRLYPSFASKIGGTNGSGLSLSTQTAGWANQSGRGLEVVEYYDADGTHILLPAISDRVDFYPNPLSGPAFVVAKRFAFNHLIGQYDHGIGLMGALAKFNILFLSAMEDNVFAPTNIIGDFDGQYKTGRRAVNRLAPGTSVDRPQSNVSYQAGEFLSRTERNLRNIIRYSVQDDGNSPLNFATGAGLDELQATANAEIQEYQKVIRYALQDLDAKRLEWDDVVSPNTRKPLAGLKDGVPGSETYTPSKDIKGSYKTKRVFGIMSGFDEPQKIVAGGQLMQMGLIDRLSLQEKIDGLDDLTLINERIHDDNMRDILRQSLMQAAGQGDQRALMLATEALPKGDPLKELATKYFTPADPQMSPEEQAMMQQGQGQGMEQPTDVTTILSRLTQSGEAQGGLQTLSTLP